VGSAALAGDDEGFAVRHGSLDFEEGRDARGPLKELTACDGVVLPHSLCGIGNGMPGVAPEGSRPRGLVFFMDEGPRIAEIYGERREGSGPWEQKKRARGFSRVRRGSTKEYYRPVGRLITRDVASV
jgi:hypothetical protein